MRGYRQGEISTAQEREEIGYEHLLLLPLRSWGGSPITSWGSVHLDQWKTRKETAPQRHRMHGVLLVRATANFVPDGGQR